MTARVSVVIPALNEEEPIAQVVRACLATNLPEEVIVVDNGSNDATAERARAAGANVVDEEVVVDGNLITSRSPADLPAFCSTIVKQFAHVSTGSPG